MITITTPEQAFTLLKEAHAFLNSCDDDSYLSEELVALEDAIATLHVAFEQWDEVAAFHQSDAVHQMRSNGAHLRADIVESRL